MVAAQARRTREEREVEENGSESGGAGFLRSALAVHFDRSGIRDSAVERVEFFLFGSLHQIHSAESWSGALPNAPLV